MSTDSGIPAQSLDNPLSETDVLIIGTGFSGLGMGISLAREGERSFVMLERAGSVGGTWRDNSYPGAACDIQSHLYSYSFRPNPDWSRVYAPQAEILAYLQKAAEEEGLIPRIHFNSEVQSATWDASGQRWVVVTDNGVHIAKALVTAAGHLSDPSYPDIPGLHSFEGELFHSARWNHDYAVEGKRIGVIGTGASAIQIVPELAKTAEQLTVFQRSAPYVIPRKDYVYTDAEKGMFRRLPQTAQFLRDELFWANESRFPQRRGVPSFIEEISATALNHLEDQVTDPNLREKLRPHYAIGCKRILISNDYFPALDQPHVDVETSGIAQVNERGVVTNDGQQIDLDLLVVATGFEASDLPIAYRVFGREGRQLAERWKNGGRAFACTTVSEFPNLFVMLGPNTGLGAGSIIYMVETQINYIREAIGFIVETSSEIEAQREAEDDYVASIDLRSEGTVWLNGGCQNWYVHEGSGRLTTLWPDFMSQFRKENGSFSSDGYAIAAMPSGPRTEAVL
ncbi:flavin-containing monooxygenase [Rhodococcus wratislaviensis]|uniref:Putative flavin-containing monooxygenase n=1 Tax=Rhodococcus wratislaviensis NBRC 100605 TaxID=1219028 RepID=X0PMJ2_RHOWR|nr:NAD(P)/FAD-dependent oxidoreductase [Rhodococcus wratislaviensis]GAF43683.1 putative flavin-containing monooxygenase [Rhodococcus wratislaviensis NBRC 100605]